MTVTRREIARGVAWATPVITLGAPAARAAGSVAGQVTVTRSTYYSAPTTGCSNGQYKLQWDGVRR